MSLSVVAVFILLYYNSIYTLQLVVRFTLWLSIGFALKLTLLNLSWVNSVF
jgi:hypothetical protein